MELLCFKFINIPSKILLLKQNALRKPACFMYARLAACV